MTTIKGAVTTAIDVAGTSQTTKRRVQKVYEDILGRSYKTEIWDLDGAGSAPYSTTLLTFNGRDQVTLGRQYSGGTSSSTYQDTTSTFDGHGRLITRHNPIENSGTNTSWAYNTDDTVASITDPRGAVTAFTYGNPSIGEKRPVLIGIAYSVPGGSGIPDPADISFEYDNVGNRKKMTDASGVLDYSYDSLSRLIAEVKDFADTLEDEPAGNYRLDYSYHIGGGLKSIESPFDEVVSYTVDKAGRTTAMPATGFGSQTSFASGIAFRAFGGVKAMTYSTTSATNITMTYDAGLRLTTYEAESSANTNNIHNKNYSYYNDGSLKEADNNVDANYTQVYEYDFAARLWKNEMNDPAPGGPAAPYTQTLGFDAFNNITSRATTTNGSTERNYTGSFTNHRKTSGGYNSSTDTHDAAGNITMNYMNATNYRTWKFDAAGRSQEWLETMPYAGGNLWDQGAISTFDGNGREAKRIKRNRNRAGGNETFLEEPEYYIWSSVTGQKITELDEDGNKKKTRVFLGGTEIAESTPAFSIRFKVMEPIAGSRNEMSVSGAILPYDTGRVEFEALGAVVPTQEEEANAPPYHKGGSIENPEFGCILNGVVHKCDDVLSLLGPIAVVDESKSDPWLLVHAKIKKGFRDVSPPDKPETTDGDHIKVETILETYYWIDPIQRNVPKQTTRPFETQKIETALTRALTNERCKNFLADLLGMVATKKNPAENNGSVLEGLKELLSDRQAGLTRDNPNNAPGVATVVGRIKKGNLKVYVKANSTGTTQEQLFADIQAILHELSHGMGRNRDYTDRDLATALYESERYGKLPNNADAFLKNPTKEMMKDAGHYGWSQYYGNLLNDFCFKKEMVINGKTVLVTNLRDLVEGL